MFNGAIVLLGGREYVGGQRAGRGWRGGNWVWEDRMVLERWYR